MNFTISSENYVSINLHRPSRWTHPGPSGPTGGWHMKTRMFLGLVSAIAILCLGSTAGAQATPTGAQAPPTATEFVVTAPADSPGDVVMVKCAGPETKGFSNTKMYKMRADYDTCQKIEGAVWNQAKCQCEYPEGKCSMDTDGDGTPEIYDAAYCEMQRQKRANRYLRASLRKLKKRVVALERWRITAEVKQKEVDAAMKKLADQFGVTLQELEGIKKVIYGNDDYEGLLPTQQRILRVLFGTEDQPGLIVLVEKNRKDIAEIKTKLKLIQYSGVVLNFGLDLGLKLNGGGPIDVPFNDGSIETVRGAQSTGLGFSGNIGYLSRNPESLSYRAGLSYLYMLTADGDETDPHWGDFQLATAEFLFGLSEKVWLGPSLGMFRHDTGATALGSSSAENGAAFGVVMRANAVQISQDASLSIVLGLHALNGQPTTEAGGVSEEFHRSTGFLFTIGTGVDFGFFEKKPVE